MHSTVWLEWESWENVICQAEYNNIKENKLNLNVLLIERDDIFHSIIVSTKVLVWDNKGEQRDFFPLDFFQYLCRYL